MGLQEDGRDDAPLLVRWYYGDQEVNPMPGKARRVASRQAQLNQRRKKQQRGPRGIPTAAPEATPQANQPVDGVDTEAMESAAPASVAAPPSESPESAAALPSPVARPAGTMRARRDSISAVNYVGTELRRILMFAGVVLAVLIALSVASWYLPVWPL
ncbi:MAG: hypothetical protein IH962_03025 [Chloroflexi bacterium]|nr:hypothetical protein [Chloroflexota bacterium]